VKAYRFDFDCVDGWAPTQPEREAVETAMRTVVPAGDATVFHWFLGGAGAVPGLTVTFDLGDRLPLEGLAVAIQAFNSGRVYVDGWLHQTCIPVAVGGMTSMAAIGRVTCTGFGAAV
jgi:hypothetical protein